MAWATRIMDGVLRTLWEMGWHSLLVSLMRWLRVFLAVHTAVDHTRVQEQQKWLWPTSCFLLVFVGWTAGDCARCSLFHCLSYTPSPPPPSPHPPPSTPPFEAAATPPSPPPQPIPIPNQNSSLALLFSPSDLSSSDFSSSDSDESDSYHERARERIKKQLQLQLQLVAGSSVLLPPKPLTTDASSTDSDSDSPQESAMTPASATVQDLVPIGYNNRRDPPAPEPSAGSSSSQPPLSPPPPPPFTAASSAPRTGPTRKPPRPRMEKPPKEFWGYLISREHPTQPTPLFRRLLSSIADYVVSTWWGCGRAGWR